MKKEAVQRSPATNKNTKNKTFKSSNDMRTTFNVSFYCRASKANKKGLSPIEMAINMNGKRLFINLPRQERAEDFQKQSVRKTGDLVKYLNLMRVRVNEIQTELMENGIPITANHIREYIQSGGIRTYEIQDLFGDYFDILRMRIGNDLTEQTYMKYERLRDEFFKYIDKTREASSITCADISSFYAYINRSQKESTTGSKMTKLKAVFRYGFDSGKLSTFPFNNVKIHKGTPVIEYLTPSELKRIEEKKIDIERLDQVRDLFLFQASSGLSYGDMAELEPDDLQEHDGTFYIKKHRIKTGIEYTAVVLERGINIFGKYEGKLPILSNQKYNSYLKELADICGIKKNITSHLARKTYATMMLNAGISITTVSKLLGHSNTNITQKHYAKTWDETVLNEVKEHIR